MRDNGYTDKAADAALSRLAGGGFLEQQWEVNTEVPPESGDFPESTIEVSYSATDWGKWAYKVCLEHLDEVTKS